ncbi:MAG: hypothetical protein ABRQ37_10305 [Candidatus Eremiobacterota bacterium]
MEVVLMVQLTVKEEIIRQIENLPVEFQIQVLNYARTLIIPCGVPGKDLLPFAGTIEVSDLNTMKYAIDNDCEKVDINEW